MKKPLFVIATGMDNTGKTTLVERLSKDLNLDVHKSIGPSTKTQYIDWMANKIQEIGNKVALFDRFPILEEMVYGELLRGGSCFNIDDDIIKWFRDELDPIIIYTRPPVEAILNFGDREQMDGVIDKAQELLNQYDELMFRLISKGFKVVFYDYTNREEIQPSHLDRIKIFIEHQTVILSHLRPNPIKKLQEEIRGNK